MARKQQLIREFCDGVGYSLFARADKPLARDLDGRRPATELAAAAEAAGIAEMTLRRAKRRLGVVSEKTSFGPDGQWFWALPLVGGVQ
mgnify:CR=1 FL=1